MILMYFSQLKILEASSDSCHISRSTVQIVKDCPNSEEQWKKAAVKKNCEAHARQCSEPERLEYHCVINPFINATLEVCAYAQNIVLGYCTEYSSSGNMIQQNANTYCPEFEKNPCPFFYRSTEAYKYPGCYNLTKQTALDPDPDPELTLTWLSVIYPARSRATNVHLSEHGDTIYIILLALLIVLTLTLLGFQIFGFCNRLREQKRPTTSEEERDGRISLIEKGELSKIS